MNSLSNDNQTDIIEAFNLIPRYLDDLLTIDNLYFEGKVNQIYPPELKLNKAKTSILRPHIWIYIYLFQMVLFPPKFMTKVMTDFDIVNLPFLDVDIPHRPSYGVYISQLIRFARVCSHVEDFNARNKCLTAKLLNQGYQYHKLRKEFPSLIADTMN